MSMGLGLNAITPSAGKSRIRPPTPADRTARGPEADAVFAALPPFHHREYIDWILAAKRPETRAHRVEETARRLKRGR